MSICLKDVSTDFIPTYAGTPKYMSPEMINQREYSYNTDVWYLNFIYLLIFFSKSLLEKMQTKFDKISSKKTLKSILKIHSFH